LIDDCVIRLAEPDDIALLPSIERRAVRLFENWMSETGLTREILEQVSSVDELEDARARGQLWVAVSAEDGPVGFAQVVVLDQAAHVDELDVVPEHGRNGIGSRLLQTVCDWARNAGYEKVTLSTFKHVPWNAPFYERRGFVAMDAERLPPQHVELVNAERARGLRTDRRVIMEFSTAAGRQACGFAPEGRCGHAQS
jgi:GNAT superfamily N-acetyltransferase